MIRHITLTVFSRLHSESIPPSFPFSSIESSEAVAAKATSSSSFPSQILTSNEGILHLATQILTALCSSMNDSATSSASSSQAEQLKFALSLINISLEAGGLIITTLPPLVDILRGELCRHLLRLSLSENMEIFSLTLRTVYNLFMSIKDHMKVQLEVFLTSVHLRMLRTSTVTPASRISLARVSILPFPPLSSIFYFFDIL